MNPFSGYEPNSFFSLFYHHDHCFFNDRDELEDLITGNWGINCHHIIIVRVIKVKIIINGTIIQFMGDRWGIHVNKAND